MRTIEGSYRKLKKEMEKELKPDRFEHSVGVAYTSAALAMRYGLDIQKAMTAGILHDCAKGIEHEEQIRFCKKRDIVITEYERKNPGLLHAKVGAYLAEHRYGIADGDVLAAIRWHTTGRPGMTGLEKIVYLADIIEPNRVGFPEIQELRDAIFRDLDEGLRLTLGHLLVYLESSGGEVDPKTRETYDFYCEEDSED